MTTAVDMMRVEALRRRPAGYAVAKKCLEVQHTAERKDSSLRTESATRLAPEARSWCVGALGEMHVGRILESLGSEWMVLHSVPIGSGTTDVDHLLIGPAGVFALNTKFHRGAKVWVGDHTVQVNGRSNRYLRASMSEATNVAARLLKAGGPRVRVHPVLVMVGVHSLVDRRAESSRDVTVVRDTDLLHWLASRPVVLGPSETAAISREAENPRTWHTDEHSAEMSRVMPRFENLCVELGIVLVPRADDAAPAASDPSRRVSPQAASRAGARTGGERRLIVTVLLAVICCAVLIPVTIQLAVMCATGLLPWWGLVVALLAVVGIVGKGLEPQSRRRRRRPR